MLQFHDFFLNSFFLGKKKLHRGQLLPGSTSEDDESKKKPPTCWSECSSPRKQVRLDKKYNKCYNFTEKTTHFYFYFFRLDWKILLLPKVQEEHKKWPRLL